MARYFVKYACTVILVTLSGCSGLTVKVKPVAIPTSAEVARAVRDLYSQAGIPPPTSKETATLPTTIDSVEFAQTGYRLTLTACNNYFDAIIKADDGLKMSKADVVAVGSAAAVISSLSKASAKQIGITAAAFGLGSILIDNLDQYAFATPYPVQTRGLILKALNAYSKSTPPSAAKTLSDAADQIAGYASICTFSGIAELSAESISKSNPEDLNKAPSLFSDADRTALQNVNKILTLPAGSQPTDDDYVTLAAVCDPKTTSDTLLKTLASTFSPAIPRAIVVANIYDDAHKKKQASCTQVWTVFASMLSGNSALQARVDSKEKQSVTTVKAALPMIGIRNP